MKYPIEKICLVYNNIDIYPSFFLILFFRMIGIYVNQFPVNYPAKPQNCADQYFAVIYIMSEHCPHEELNRYKAFFDHYSQGSLFLAPFSSGDYSKSSEDTDSFVLYPENPKQFNRLEKQTLLKRVISAVGRIVKEQDTSSFCWLDTHWERVKNDWERLADLYIKYDLLYLSLSGKFFYPDKRLFSQIKPSYIGLIKEILESIGGWDEHDSRLYSRFALVNMAYELNTLCKKNDSPYIFNSRQLVDLCNNLMEQYGKSANLLLLKGEIYEDLLKEYTSAYACYDAAHQKSNGRNAYVLYRRGLYKEKILLLWEDAIRDYEKALKIYPAYYRVKYRQGVCEEKLEHTHGAVDAYKKIFEILEDKSSVSCVSPTESEYLYKTSLKLASLYEYGAEDNYYAFRYYRKNRWICFSAVRSHFLETLIGEEAAEELIGIMREHLNPSYAEKKLYWHERSQEAVKELQQG